MGMLNNTSAEAALRTPGGDTADENERLTCPHCGASFTEDEAKQSAGQTPGEMSQQQAPPSEPAPTGALKGTCPECGDKMTDGECPSCGYTATRSPMREAAKQYASSRPEGERPDVSEVVRQGRRAREYMRRPARYGRG